MYLTHVLYDLVRNRSVEKQSSRDVRFEFRLGLPLTEVSHDFPQSLQKNSGVVPRLDHDSLLKILSNSTFTIHHHIIR